MYLATQMFTEHRCFDSYLYCIEKEDNARCHHCEGDEQTAQQTMKICSAWAEEHHVLVQIIGENDFSLSSIVAAREREREGVRGKEREREKEKGRGRGREGGRKRERERR
ncbi:hypothetical protein ACFW04_012930 [Cataglyphis niger]